MMIMIVDDDSTIRQGITQILKKSTMEEMLIIESDNGLDALHKLYEHEISLVFVDIKMPVMNGMDFLQAATPHFPETVFIVISAYGEFEYAQRALRYGAKDYLLKPIQLEDIVEILNHHKSTTNKIHKMINSNIHSELRNDVHEALKLLITQGIRAPFLSSGIPAFYEQTSWVITIIDINSEYENNLPLIELIVKESTKVMKKSGLWFDNDQNFLLIQYDKLHSWLYQIHEALSEYHEQYTIAISSQVLGINNLQKCYFESCEALTYRIVNRKEVIYYQPRIQILYDSENSAKGLVNAIKKDNTSLAGHVQIQINSICEACHNSSGNIFYLVDQLLIHTISLLSREQKEAIDKLNSDLALEKLRRARSQDELVQLVSSFLKNLLNIYTLPTVDYYNQIITKSKLYIKEHMAKDITLEDVANALNISAGHFSRLFIKQTGENFISYLTDLRLNKGIELLRTGDYRIYEVSEKVGYTSWKHFSRLFKQKFGMTQNEFMGKKL